MHNVSLLQRLILKYYFGTLELVLATGAYMYMWQKISFDSILENKAA